MEFTEESLSSVWEGTSISRMNDPTEWKETCVSFREVSSAPNDEDGGSSRKVFEIIGKGTSLWRTLSIDFTLAGHFDSYTNRFQIRKRHQGKYTNEVVYLGSIHTVADRENGGFIFKISGNYHNGSIDLRQKPGGISHLLCRVTSDYIWEGSSISRTNDKTDWNDVKLHFHPPPTAREALAIAMDEHSLEGEEALDEAVAMMNECTITGSGVSLWREIEIHFDIRGTLNLQTLACKLEKEHRGAYTNVVNYQGLLDLERFCIIGQYGNGDIELLCNGLLDEEGRWSGEDWRLLSSRLLCASHDVLQSYSDYAVRMEHTGFDLIREEGGVEEEGTGEEGKWGDEEEELEIDDLPDLFKQETKEDEVDNMKLAQAQANARPTTEDDVCKICYENNISCVFVPCGHFCTCLACGIRLDDCCICREKISLAQKVFRA
ncbi:hypothetical protein TrVE_jg3070 [Triparma verrucosa]|uniref:RING-type domain-containing protein n=1 Tax=Triparma verrucosa TaxID=1606542 RepID=A0A9W7DKT4_9STRA|nr:hypothetical protein TrVE_jg3070 [Triparma verrucosa]